MASQSSIIRHVPSRAGNIDQILDYASKLGITNEMLIKVGLRMNGNLLFGSNHRCVAMLIVFKSIMDDVDKSELAHHKIKQPIELNRETPARTFDSDKDKPLNRLQTSLKNAVEFLDFCRPLSVSMTNAYKLIKEEILNLLEAITNLDIENLKLQDADSRLDQTSRFANTNTAALVKIAASNNYQVYEEQKQRLAKFIDRFIDEEIWSAQRGICDNIIDNINTGDVILIYGCSTIVQLVLLYAKSHEKTFRVIVVDSPPHFNGRRIMKLLTDNSIDASYTLINSLSFVMRQATKVLLGANSILANGYVMSQIGTSQVALMAKAINVPTLVCCETYKLSDRVYVDSFGCNEVDSGHELGSGLNLRYDLTPPEFISMVINEKCVVPAQSVPALLRFRAEKTRAHVQASV